jgi:hypothetical protein
LRHRLILQHEKKFDEAIAVFGVIFPSRLNDYALEPGSSEDCKNYRYKAALRTSECYESKNDLSHALEFAKQAASKYPYVLFCSFCQKQGRDAAAKRVADLEKKMASAK